MKKDKSDDRRVQRTRRSLTQALLSLLPERGWDDLSIQDICDRADVGRSTFYAHFQNKEELLVGSLNDLRTLLSRPSPDENMENREVLPFVYGLIEHIHENRKLCRSIFGRRSGHVVQIRFREMVTALVRENLTQVVRPGWQRDAAIQFITGALVEMLAWLIETKSSPSVKETEQYFLHLASPAIARLTASA